LSTQVVVVTILIVTKYLWNELLQQWENLNIPEKNTVLNKPKSKLKEMSMRDIWNSLGIREPSYGSRVAFQKLLDREVQNVNNTVSDLLRQKNWFNVANLQELHSNFVLEQGVERGSLRKDVTVGSYQFYTTYRTFLPPEEIETGLQIVNECLNSEQAAENPLLRAFYAYSALIFYIHPFEDGNGRTGRIICNMFIIEAGYPSAIGSQDKTLSLADFVKKVVEA